MACGCHALVVGMSTCNTEGLVMPADHCRVPLLERGQLEEVLGLIRDPRSFVLHAHCQTGQTAPLLAPRELLTSDGTCRCVSANVEVAQTAGYPEPTGSPSAPAG